MRPAVTSGWRLASALLMVFALTLQSFVTQTHIHGAGSAAPTQIGKSVGADNTQAAGVTKRTSPSPSRDDSAKCPICQAIGFAGQFVAPAAIAIVLPSQNVSQIPLWAMVAASLDVASHNWQGRAPPRA